MKSEETIAIEVQRRLRELAREAGKEAPEAYLVRLNPRVAAYFTGEGGRVLAELEADTGRFFSFTGSEGLPLDHFAILMEGSRDEVLAEAVPFSEGDEVHVEIVEPHMYNEDDAVAKVDGYLIEVVNALGLIGRKVLVRIEDAGRTAARAVLAGDEAEEAEAAAQARRKARERRERDAARRARARATGDGGGRRAEPEDEPKAEASVDAAVEPAPAGTAPAAVEDAAEPEGEDETLESKPRRRGRRGGRRRSRAKAQSESSE